MTRILIVEDEESFSDPLSYSLRKEGYEVAVADTGTDGLRIFTAHGADLVLLDLMLPGMSGTEVCREIRRTSTVPVIMLTAKDDEFDKVLGLELGADDYVTKPFDLEELIARIEVLLRRTSHASGTPQPLTYGDLTLDPATARVTIGGVEPSLTVTELRILQLLLEQPGQVFSRPRIYEAVWQERFVGDDAAVKTHVSNLRTKLREAAPDHDPVETVWGLGYRLRAVAKG